MTKIKVKIMGYNEGYTEGYNVASKSYTKCTFCGKRIHEYRSIHSICEELRLRAYERKVN